ncbi:hypothetical protein [Phaeobacter italicus]|jgi:hypothetical protein|uniref:hypothetical protein n=1 Tax=Phaeobacter italicus TaxID=481446 RepID=UPI002FDE8E31
MSWGKGRSGVHQVDTNEIRDMFDAWRGYMKHPDLADRVSDLIDEIERLRNLQALQELITQESDT